MIYLASPYSHPDRVVREGRFRAACEKAAAMMRDGLLVYSPVCHGHPLAERGLPRDWSYWAEHNRWMLGGCNALWVMTLPGWEDSEGVQTEIETAHSLGFPIRYGPEESEGVGA